MELLYDRIIYLTKEESAKPASSQKACYTGLPSGSDTMALADALIEALCDFAEAEVCSGLDTSGRFSPGYADLELSLGKEIIALTDAERTLGIKLTESGLMVPKKSVNAIIAVRNLKND